MRDKLKELFEARNKIVEDQRAMVDKADEESRDFTSEETETYENMDADFEKLTTEIDELREKIKTADERKTKLEERKEFLAQSTLPDDLKTQVIDDDLNENRTSIQENAMSIFNKALRDGREALSGEELRALQADQDTKGGYLVAPEVFVNQLLKDVDDRVIVRQLSTIQKITTSDEIGVPELADDIADFDWTTEIKTGTEDTTMDFAKRTMKGHPMAKRIKVSEKLIRLSQQPVDALVRARMSYKIGITAEKKYMEGTGVNEPLGLFTAHNAGISTSQDISTGNTATQIKADGLINCMYNLKEQYMRTGVWLFHRDGVKMIRKLKDGEGNYIWNSGIASDRPATILDRPYHMSEYVPNTFTTGLYVGIFGDLSYYWILDCLNIQIKVLNELYAETGQIGYIGRYEGDGAPVLQEAFSRVKLG